MAKKEKKVKEDHLSEWDKKVNAKKAFIKEKIAKIYK
tara:strand:+ start:2150 stop:2260 length:111 start_codon:yes stop_codon:yes gene_type:complete